MANSGFAVDVYSAKPSNDLILTVSRYAVSGLSTRWSWTLKARKFGATSYWLDPIPWSVNVEGDTWSGTHNLDFRSTSEILIASGTTGWKAHNSSGDLTVNFSASHGPTSTFGTAALSGSFAADRLPTIPSAPVPIAIDQVTSSALRYRFSAGAGGGTPTSWELQYATNSAFTGATTLSSGVTGTTTISGLTAGARYWVRVRGVNANGSGPYSTVLDATLLLGAPALSSWAQNAAGGLVATWAAPAPSTGLTGYRLQIARDSGFTTGVQLIELGSSVLTYTLNGQVGGRTYYARVAAVNAGGTSSYSAARSVVLVLSAGDLDGWTRITPTPAGLAYYTAEGIRRSTTAGKSSLLLETIATGAATIAADATGIQRTVTGLVIGQAYRFEASAMLTTAAPTVKSYRLSVVGKTSAAAVTVTAGGISLGYVEFVATAASHELRILAGAATIAAAADEIERVAFYSVKLLQLVTDYPVRLRETVYESNLANHFDLACNSVGASWYVGKDGVTRFRLPGAALPVSATFTDQPDDSALHYVDTSVSYDTRGMVNRLDVTNYGVDAARTNELNDELVVTSDSSIATYGVRSSRLQTNLYGLAPYDASLNARLAELLAGAAAPRLFVSAVRWNAQEDLAAANQLDVGQRVLVRFNGTEQDSQIVALQHDITPRRWIVTATLRSL